METTRQETASAPVPRNHGLTGDFLSSAGTAAMPAADIRAAEGFFCRRNSAMMGRTVPVIPEWKGKADGKFIW
jgi:hypothetical protein